jgi:hypothetical protein
MAPLARRSNLQRFANRLLIVIVALFVDIRAQDFNRRSRLIGFDGRAGLTEICIQIRATSLAHPAQFLSKAGWCMTRLALETLGSVAPRTYQHAGLRRSLPSVRHRMKQSLFRCAGKSNLPSLLLQATGCLHHRLVGAEPRDNADADVFEMLLSDELKGTLLEVGQPLGCVLCI